MASALTMDDLPDEVLEFLFSKFSFSDRKILRLVNKRWLSVCNSTAFTKNERLKLNLIDLHQLKLRRGCFNLEIIDDKSTVEIKDALLQQQEFWMEHRKAVRSVEVTESKDYCPIIYKIFQYCCNIKELSFLFFGDMDINISDDEEYENDSCNDAKFDDVTSSLNDFDINDVAQWPKLDCLSSLSLSGDNLLLFIAGPAFFKLTTSVPNLRRLELRDVNDREESFKKAILTLIAKQSLTLSELVFTNSKIVTNKFIAQVLLLVGPQLTSLHLIELPLSRVDCLERHINKFSNLQILEFNDIKLSERSDLSWLEYYNKLKFISFQRTDLFQVLVPLDKLENLKGLDICFTTFTAKEILRCFGVKVHLNLIALRMSGVTDDVLEVILPKLPNLKFFDCRDSDITNMGVQAILVNCKRLTHLDLSFCTKMEDLSESINKSLPNLVYLNLLGCLRLILNSLRLDKLNTIGLNGVSVSKEKLKELLKNCPRLKNVQINPFFSQGSALSDVLRESGIRNDALSSMSIFDFSKD